MIHAEQIGPVKRFRLARTVAGRGLYYTAAYLVDGLMVDSGCHYTVAELLRAVHDEHVSVVVNTHSHEDHVAANAALQKRFGAEVMAHRAALPILAKPWQCRLRPYQKVMWGRPEPCQATAVGRSVRTERFTFRIIHTPGHSPDHICLYEPDQGWLFTGDAYVGGRDRALRLEYNIWQIIDSLKELASLQPKVLFTGSGSVRADPDTELAEKISYLEDAGRKVLDLHARGWSRRRIRRRLFGREMPIAYLTLGNFSGRNLVRSYIEDAPSA